jgi:hypothetical protein
MTYKEQLLEDVNFGRKLVQALGRHSSYEEATPWIEALIVIYNNRLPDHSLLDLVDVFVAQELSGSSSSSPFPLSLPSPAPHHLIHSF